jgi:competence protein ComFC
MDHLPGHLAYRAYRLFWTMLDWIYPPNCGGCGKPGTRWCKVCAQNTPEMEPPICPICGDLVVDEQPCQRCQTLPVHFTSLRSYTIYQGAIREAVHKLKYGGDKSMGDVLAQMMISGLEKLNWSLDIVTSVPLGLVRFAERGYNQATLLARPIALSQNMPFSTKLLFRVRETQTQVGLTMKERQENMEDAFRAVIEQVEGKNILVVDDVATSGATINGCARALRAAGASKVYGYTLARAILDPHQEIGKLRA